VEWYWLDKIEVKVKFSLEQATKAQRGCRGIALLFFLTLPLHEGEFGEKPIPVPYFRWERFYPNTSSRLHYIKRRISGL
jgi:hypothetical protein